MVTLTKFTCFEVSELDSGYNEEISEVYRYSDFYFHDCEKPFLAW